MKFIIFLFIICIDCAVYAGGHECENKKNPVLESYDTSILQFYSLSGIQIVRVTYNDNAIEKINKYIFDSKMGGNCFEYLSYIYNNKEFGVYVFHHKNKDDLKKTEYFLKKRTVFPRKVLTTYNYKVIDDSIYLYYGNYLQINSIKDLKDIDFVVN